MCKQAVHKLFITAHLESQKPACIAQGTVQGWQCAMPAPSSAPSLPWLPCLLQPTCMGSPEGSRVPAAGNPAGGTDGLICDLQTYFFRFNPLRVLFLSS